MDACAGSDVPHVPVPRAVPAQVVNGPGSLPLYRFLKLKSPKTAPFDLCGECDVSWNYEKFLVNASGWPVKRYPAGISPMVAEMDVRELLNASHAGQTAALVVASS